MIIVGGDGRTPERGAARPAVWRVAASGAPRLAVGAADSGPERLLSADVSLDDLLASAAAFAQHPTLGEAPPPDVELLAPLDGQEVWAAGVTFTESRFAREHESSRPDFYHDVYRAQRPELFFKAAPGTAVGSGQPIGIRADSPWNVPEPELVLIVAATAEIVGLSVGNDVSSRSIEGENPLYLPQAKVYDRSCAIGPAIVPLASAPPLAELRIEMEVRRGGAVAFEGETVLAKLRRSPEELVDWLFRARRFPRGVALLTGTGVVPPPEFTLLVGDVVTIDIPGVGRLVNPVEAVGVDEPNTAEAAGAR